MKLKKIEEVEAFLAAAKSCEGDVILTSPYGDKYSMKSALSQYIAIGALLGEHGDELEIWCTNKSDEPKIIQFLRDYDL